ncbi:MAG: Ribbon-helix-helix domain [Solirubrobacteraceae bacterium]|jgi:uncharacterized membrane protein|nr:Ribbon-helix-helix domain [Solirubrobacteraceae bacterium]
MASSNSTVQRNFHLPTEQAEWLREHAHRTRRPQAEIVREALAEYRARTEKLGGPAPHDRNRSLMDRFKQGRGIDIDVLRDENGTMWSHDT